MFNLILFISFSNLALVNDLPEMHPTIVEALVFSEDVLQNFNSPEMRKKATPIFEKLQQPGFQRDQLSDDEKNILKYVSHTRESPWFTVGAECNFYCGGSPLKVMASSELKPSGSHTYSAQNAHDFRFKNAWAEGVDGYGIGESLTYFFAGSGPRITEILIANGYVKTPEAWKNNSRVKKLKLYYNQKPIAILHLKDTRDLQSFEFSPLGTKRDQSPKPWSLKFEIMEVYPGEKFDDVVISEIFFEGIDAH